MAMEHTVNVYGVFLTPEEIAERENKRFEYFKALISVEKTNPEQDWDGEIFQNIMERIGTADLNSEQRKELIKLLKQ